MSQSHEDVQAWVRERFGDAPRAEIDAATERLAQEIEGIGLQARENAYFIERDGLTIGEGKDRLVTGGDGAWVAPKRHPAWADALRHETRVLRQMGEISNPPREWETDYQKWPPMLEEHKGFEAGATAEETQQAFQEHTRRLGLSVDERRAEHEERWAGLEERLKAMDERNAAYFAKHPYTEEQSHVMGQELERRAQAVESMKTTAGIQLQYSTHAEASEQYIRSTPHWWESRFADPLMGHTAVERERVLRQQEGGLER